MIGVTSVTETTSEVIIQAKAKIKWPYIKCDRYTWDHKPRTKRVAPKSDFTKTV